MQWQDEGIIISQKPIGEKGILLSVFTPSHGIYKGFFKKSATKKIPFLQPGNIVQLTWKARLQDHLGLWTQIEAKGPSLLHHFFGKKEKLFALSSLLTLLEMCLPERDPHPTLYAATRSLIETIALSFHTEWIEAYICFETTLLKEIGYGLSLDQCAVTGKKEGLLYVSPKTGCAVTEEGAGPYKDKLLPLPSFLKKSSENTSLFSEHLKGFQLTSHFLHKALENNFTTLPEARVSLQSWAENFATV